MTALRKLMTPICELGERTEATVTESPEGNANIVPTTKTNVNGIRTGHDDAAIIS